MNIYFLNPKWVCPDRIISLTQILKVKKVFCFLEQDNNVICKIPKYISLFNLNNNDVELFLKQCVYSFVNEISEPLICDGNYTGDRIVKDVYKDSLSRNPIYNIENLDDPNILILYDPIISNQLKYGIIGAFRKYSMNILNKYGQINYMDRICFYMFDKFLHCSYIYYPIENNKYRLINSIIYSERSIYRSDIHDFITQYSAYDPLLSYIRFKIAELGYKESVQSFFLTKEGLENFERITIDEYKNYLSSRCDGYFDVDDVKAFEEVCKKEEEYIINNGGDWIYD